MIEYCVELYLPGSFKDWGQRHIPHTEIEVDLSEYGWTDEDGTDEQTVADWLVEASCQMTNEDRNK